MRHNRLFQFHLADADPLQPGNIARIIIHHNQRSGFIGIDLLPGFARKRVLNIRGGDFRADAQRAFGSRRERAAQQGFIARRADKIGFAGFAESIALLDDSDDLIGRHLHGDETLQLAVFIADLRNHKRRLLSARRRIGIEIRHRDFFGGHGFRKFNGFAQTRFSQIALWNNHAEVGFFFRGIDNVAVGMNQKEIIPAVICQHILKAGIVFLQDAVPFRRHHFFS